MKFKYMDKIKDYIIEKKSGIITKRIYYNLKSIGYIKYTVKPKESFLFNDLYEYTKYIMKNKDVKFLEILDIYILPEYRNFGHGSKLVKDLVDKYDDYIIFTASGASMSIYKECPSIDICNYINTKLSHFYIRNGFKNVNYTFGYYEYKEAYVYNNDTAVDNNIIVDDINDEYQCVDTDKKQKYKMMKELMYTMIDPDTNDITGIVTITENGQIIRDPDDDDPMVESKAPNNCDVLGKEYDNITVMEVTSIRMCRKDASNYRDALENMMLKIISELTIRNTDGRHYLICVSPDYIKSAGFMNISGKVFAPIKDCESLFDEIFDVYSYEGHNVYIVADSYSYLVHTNLKYERDESSY